MKLGRCAFLFVSASFTIGRSAHLTCFVSVEMGASECGQAGALSCQCPTVILNRRLQVLRSALSQFRGFKILFVCFFSACVKEELLVASHRVIGSKVLQCCEAADHYHLPVLRNTWFLGQPVCKVAIL